MSTSAPISPRQTKSTDNMTARSLSQSPSKKPQPFSSQFLDKDARASEARATYLKILIGGAFFVTLAIFALFSIFWGALWKSPVRHLHGWIVDFDGDQIGQVVLQGIRYIPSTLSKVSWEVRSASDFPRGASDLSAAIVEEKSWVAIAINSGATTNLRSAVASANSSYDSSSAVTAYAAEARNENAFRSLIRPTVEGSVQIISQRFALEFAKQLASSQTNLTNLLSTAPNVVTQPLSYTLVNLRPFDVPVATAVTFVGLIYMLILSFFVVMIGDGAREAAGLEQSLTTGSLIRVRTFSAIVVYFFLSFFYSLLSLAFQLPFDRKFGHAGFLVFWMLNWFGMMAVGLALESLITILTIRFIPFFMILWIIANISVCFLPLEVLPGIYRYGHAAPFYTFSRAVRTIVFGTKNTVGLDFGVLIIWTAISCTTLPLFTWLKRRREVNDIQAAHDLNEKAF